MRLILFIFLIVNLLGAKDCKAQGPGTFQWTNGAPNNNPGLSGAKFAVDKNTYRWYEWVSGTSWVESGDRIQRISGCSAPNYTPAIHQSHVVINGCTSPNIPEIYAWMGSAWVKLNPSGGATYTAGTGIAISGGNVISADTSILATQYDISQLGVTFPLLAPTETVPQYSFGESVNSGMSYFSDRGVNTLSILGADEGGLGTLINIRAGEGAEGGSFSMQAGMSSGEGGYGGAFVMSGGEATGTAGLGGSFSMSGGAGTTGGDLTILGGFGSAAGGNVDIFSGESAAGAQGAVRITTFTGDGGTGSMTLTTGTGRELPITLRSAGLQFSNLTTAQRDALVGVGQGRILWNSTTKYFNLHDGTSYYEVPKTLKASATLNFPSTAANTNSDLTINVTGAALGDIVDVAPAVAAIVTRSCYTAWVSAVNTVTVRFNNYNTAAPADPASATFNVIVSKF